MKRFLSILLTVMLMLSVIPLGLFSITASAATSGTTGNCTWTLDGTVLTISGNGSMENYTYSYSLPWGISITEVIINAGVTSIGDYAFKDCTSLTSVTIPDSITSIGDFAFDGCTNLKEVHTNDIAKWCSIKFSYYSSNPIYYAHNLYLNGKLITNLVIPNSVTNIGDYAFENCTSFISITIPDSVTSIGDDAFNGCISLTNITIPDSVTSIGDDAFNGCISLTNITIPNSITNIGIFTFGNCTGLKSINIPDCITNIKAYAFSGCTGLTSVIMPDGVTTIGMCAFSSCTGLTSITIPDSATIIGGDAFFGCFNLKEIHITDLTSWCNINFSNKDSNPLYYAHNLYLNGELITNLVIPNSVTNIGEQAFYSCTGLTSITIPDSVTTIGASAFYDCSKLGNLTINGAERLYENSFSNCNSLKNIYLSKNLKTVYNGAFGGINSIENIYYEGSEEEWNAVTILPNNDALKKANVYFNSVGIPDEVPTAPELLRKTACTVTLKHIDGCEYRLNDGEWQSSNVFTELNPNTEYKFYRRTAAADESPAGAASYALSVVTSEIIRGDINDDREVNILDLIYLKKFFADPLNNVVPSECLDVSGDGRINSADLAALRKNLLLQ